MYSITLNFITRGFIILFGLFGNIMVMIVFSAKAFKKFPSRNIYRILVVFDSILIIFSISIEFLKNFGSIFLISELFGKIVSYFESAFLTPYLLVFISIEKFITIRFPNNKIIKKSKFQTILVFALMACNLIVYHPFFYLNIYKANNSSNQTSQEVIREANNAFGIICYIYNIGLPFIIMMVFSTLLVHTIFKSRLRILRLTNQHDRNRLKKDIQFAISSIFLNLFFLILYLPNTVYSFIKTDLNTDLFVNIFTSLTYINFCDHFYILFCFNSVFRRRVLVLLRLKSQLS